MTIISQPKPLVLGTAPTTRKPGKLHLVDTKKQTTPCGKQVDEGWRLSESDTANYKEMIAVEDDALCRVCAGVYWEKGAPGQTGHLVNNYPGWYEDADNWLLQKDKEYEKLYTALHNPPLKALYRVFITKEDHVEDSRAIIAWLESFPPDYLTR